MEVLTHIGRYRIESELGRGSMGVVFKAFDPVVERVVAIKTIPLNAEDSEVLIHRLQREAKSVGQLEHPNIVTLYDAGEASGLFYMAMQFIQGETLRDRISRQRWFTMQEIQAFFKQICAALDYAHRQGVVHRDIKPSNIMITPDEVVKLTDFGIAKLAGAGTTNPGMIMGTPSYMSPEQALGKPLDGRSDIFSLGSILYELITGEQAFPGSNATTVMYRIVHEPPSPITALQPGIGPAGEAIVMKALAKQPEQRFQTCAELAVTLDYYVQGAIAGTPQAAGVSIPSGAALAHQSGSNFPTASLPGVASASPQPAFGKLSPRRLRLVWLAGSLLVTLLFLAGVWKLSQPRRPDRTASSLPTAAISSCQTQPTASVPAQSTTSPAATTSSGEPPVSRPGSSTATLPSPLSPSPVRKPTPSPPATIALKPPTSKGTEEKVPSRVPDGNATPPSPAPVPPIRQTQPGTFQGYMLTGDVAFQQSRYEDALAAYSKAHQLNPNSREVRRKLAVVLTLLGRADEARRYK